MHWLINHSLAVIPAPRSRWWWPNGENPDSEVARIYRKVQFGPYFLQKCKSIHFQRPKSWKLLLGPIDILFRVSLSRDAFGVLAFHTLNYGGIAWFGRKAKRTWTKYEWKALCFYPRVLSLTRVVWTAIIHAINKQVRTNGPNSQPPSRARERGGIGMCLCFKTTQTIAYHESFV